MTGPFAGHTSCSWSWFGRVGHTTALGRFATTGIVLTLWLLVGGAPANAQSSDLVDRFEDELRGGEFDFDDLVAFDPSRRAPTFSRAPPWLSVVAYTHESSNAAREVGFSLVLGVPLERVVFPSTTASISDEAAEASRSVTVEKMPLDAKLAQRTIIAAWRAQGLEQSEAQLGAMATRARWSGLLPETRLRATRLIGEQGRVEGPIDDVRYVDASDTNLWLEARLTWRLDRLLYSDDEPSLERARAERMEAKSRLAAKVLDVLFRWQRADLEIRAASQGTQEESQAWLRAFEAEIALDVLTGGWFSTWRRQAEGSRGP